MQLKPLHATRSKNTPIKSLNTAIDLAEAQEEFEARLGVELMEERLELGCWIRYDCIMWT